MKTSSSRLVWFLIFILITQVCAPRTTLAQNSPDAVAAERPPIHFQVLKSWRADMGDHAILLNQVAPPVLPLVSAVLAPSSPPASGALPPRRPAAAKKSDLLFLSATVQDHRFTLLRWMEDGQPCSAFSNVDFNLLGGSLTFETADTVYSLMLAIVNVSTDPDSGEPPVKPVPGRSPLSPAQLAAVNQLDKAHAQYFYAVDEAGQPPPERQLAALDALHLSFDANRTRLAAEYAAREAAQIAEALRPKSPPPPQPDTVVNFWPGPGTVLLDATRKEAKP